MRVFPARRRRDRRYCQTRARTDVPWPTSGTAKFSSCCNISYKPWRNYTAILKPYIQEQAIPPAHPPSLEPICTTRLICNSTHFTACNVSTCLYCVVLNENAFMFILALFSSWCIHKYTYTQNSPPAAKSATPRWRIGHVTGRRSLGGKANEAMKQDAKTNIPCPL